MPTITSPPRHCACQFEIRGVVRTAREYGVLLIDIIVESDQSRTFDMNFCQRRAIVVFSRPDQVVENNAKRLKRCGQVPIASAMQDSDSFSPCVALDTRKGSIVMAEPFQGLSESLCKEMSLYLWSVRLRSWICQSCGGRFSWFFFYRGVEFEPHDTRHETYVEASDAEYYSSFLLC